MATFRIELFKGKTLSDGRHPVCLLAAIGQSRARKVIASASVDEWDSKNSRIKPRSRKDYGKVNADIENEYNKYEAVFLDLKRSGRTWHPNEVFAEEVFSSPLFLENSLHYIQYLKTKNVASWEQARAIHKKIEAYAGKDFPVDSINLRWINGFKVFLKDAPYNNSDNKILYDIKYIKRVVKYAGVENATLKAMKISYAEVLKPKLTIAELAAIETLDLSGLLRLTQHTFLLQFYLWGMRIGDLLLMKQSNIIDGRLSYSMSKTGKVRTLAIPDQAMKILSEYLDPSKEYLLPWIRWKHNENLSPFENDKALLSEVKNRTVIVNRYLKDVAEKAKITKNLTTHIARHTFASIGDLKLGGNLDLLQKMLGHSSRAMTERYVNDLRKSDVLDEAAKKIFG